MNRFHWTGWNFPATTGNDLESMISLRKHPRMSRAEAQGASLWERKKVLMYKVNAYAFRLLSFMCISFLIGGALLPGCAKTPIIGAPVDPVKLKDGIYEGSYEGGPNKASVKVTIKDNSIINIEIVEHQAWKGKKAELPIVERIISTQSTKVDGVSGATNSSRVIMNAVHKAIEKAYQN